MADGTFQMMMEASASGDPRRIRAAHDDAVTAIGCIGSMLNVLADYAYLRGQHPKDCLYANDYDVADMAYTLSDLASCAHAALTAAAGAESNEKGA